MLSEMTLKTQTEPKTTGSLDIAGRILRWNFFQYNVTESGNLCRLTALYNAAHKVPFAIKGHACALRPGTFAYMQAAPPEAPPQKPPFRSQVAQVKTCKAAPTRRRTLSAVRFERISRCFGTVWVGLATGEVVFTCPLARRRKLARVVDGMQRLWHNICPQRLC